jgi:dihydroneopterin aldolase
VMPHETRVGQRFVIDLELAVDLAPAGRSDKLADTASYGTIVEVATHAFTTASHRLVEAAAASVADALLGGFPQVTSVRVTVHKPHAPVSAIFNDVGVSILRARHG